MALLVTTVGLVTIVGLLYVRLNQTAVPEQPSSLTHIASVRTGLSNGNQRAEISGLVLCLTSPSPRAQFFSLTNPAAPTQFAEVEMPSPVLAVAHWGQYFYLSGAGWLRTIAVSNQTWMITDAEVHLPSNTLSRLLVNRGYLFAAAVMESRPKQGRIHIFSLANPARPQLVSTVTSPPLSGFADLAVKDDLLYAGDYFGRRIEVYDIAEVTTPLRIHSQTIENRNNYTSFEPWRLLIKDQALYVQDDASWQVFSLQDPRHPSYRFDLQVARDIEGSQLVGNLLLWSASGVRNSKAGVLVFDCRKAMNPVLLGRTDFGEFSGYYWGAMNEQYIYQPEGSQLHVLKVPLPAGAR
jgi:hypothetical protein